MLFFRYCIGIVLFASQFSHSAEYSQAVHPACEVPVNANDNVYEFYANLDGSAEGPSAFVADRSDGTTIIYSCDNDAPGPWGFRDGNKPISLLVIDVEGDGKDELLISAPTGSSPLIGSVERLIGTNLVSKNMVSLRPATKNSDGETFGCIDTDDDDRRELINYTFTESKDGTRLSWLGSDGREGSFKLPDEATRAWIFKSGLCGNQITLNYAVRFMPAGLKPHLNAGQTIKLGINNQLLLERTAEDLEDVSNWLIPVEHFAGYEGPFFLPPFMEKARKITIGEHKHCAGGPLKPPDIGEENLIQISMQPTQIDSCLSWFAVDYWVRSDFSIAAIILNIWEP